VVLAKSVVDRLHRGDEPIAAARHALNMLAQRTGGAAGCIVLRPDGTVGVFHNTPRMAYAYRCDDGAGYVGIKHDQAQHIRSIV
jgi:beta-aspartyl-peptidase (threonine type)